MLPLWALLLATTLAWLWRRHGARWGTLALLCSAAIASHIASDVITSYGTQILSPLSDYRAALYTTFIIDPWFSLIIVAALAVAVARRSQSPARAGLLVLLGYVGLQAGLQHEARALAVAHAEATGMDEATAQALAQPYTPFRWKLVIQEPDRFHEALVDLANLRLPLAGDDSAWWQVLNNAYPLPDRIQWTTYPYPDSPEQPAWVRAAWQAPKLAPYRRFVMLPVVYRIENSPGHRCAWFTDRRFALPGLTPPFRYGVCEG